MNIDNKIRLARAQSFLYAIWRASTFWLRCPWCFIFTVLIVGYHVWICWELKNNSDICVVRRGRFGNIYSKHH